MSLTVFINFIYIIALTLFLCLTVILRYAMYVFFFFFFFLELLFYIRAMVTAFAD